ncbi:carbohydrate binding family 9 domain-containing protein, partial [Saprospiraceae bacterium]|nr:carbohydrate binding family 9 domain-containing protein [Saprospiraceae bacterium]
MINQLKIANIFLTIFLINLNVAQAQTAESQITNSKYYTTNAISSSEAPLIDGKHNETIWNAVQWDGQFTQREPNEGEKPTEATDFKILYDDKNLYVALKCLDKEPSKIEKRLSRRDGFEGDWVEINIDSYHDLQTAFSFTVTAAGVKGDELISRDGNNWDSSWNPIWYVKTSSDEKGWYAEMKIPLSQLRFGKDTEQTWGLQV